MKVLYIMSSYNLYGGTPKKTLDLMRHFREDSVLYVYHNSYSEFKQDFKNTGGEIYEGFYGRNVFLHTKKILSIIDKEEVDIVQTQFSMGETLGFLLKIFRPKIKLVFAFVGSLKPSVLKTLTTSFYYNFVDQFIYISKYVEEEKKKQYSILKRKKGEVIYNGTEKRLNNKENIIMMKKTSLLDIAGLTDIKNIKVLIEAINIIVNLKKREEIFLYVAGNGNRKKELEELISNYNLQEYVFLLGYQTNVGKLLDSCDIFVHPCYVEGFGIVVSEAMLAEKPIIVSNAGALPELIINNKSGLLADPHNSLEWANAILKIIDNKDFASELALNAKKRAEKLFTKDIYTKNYKNLYTDLLKK